MFALVSTMLCGYPPVVPSECMPRQKRNISSDDSRRGTNRGYGPDRSFFPKTFFSRQSYRTLSEPSPFGDECARSPPRSSGLLGILARLLRSIALGRCRQPCANKRCGSAAREVPAAFDAFALRSSFNKPGCLPVVALFYNSFRPSGRPLRKIHALDHGPAYT